MAGAGSRILDWVKTCCGVDPQHDGLRMVFGHRTSGGITTSPASQKDAIASINSGSVPVVACLSARDSVTRWVEAPFSNHAKAAMVFPTLLDVELPFPLEECVYLFLDPHVTPDGKTRALAVVARIEAVRKRVDELAALGIEPVALDHEGLALWTQSRREIPATQGSGDGVRVVALLRPDRWTVVIGKNDRFLSCNSIKTGDYGQIRRLVMNASGNATALQSVQWCLAGSLAVDPTVERDFKSQAVQSSADVVAIHESSEFFMARAVATRALEAGELRCNLRSGELTHPMIVARREKQMLKAGIIAAAAGLMLCASATFAMVAAHDSETAARQLFAGMIKQLDVNVGGALGEQAVSIARRGVATRLESQRPFINAFEPSLVDTIKGLGDLAAKKGVSIEQVTIARDKILVTGRTRTWDSCEALVAYLQKNGYHVKSDRKENLSEETVAFSIGSITGR